MSKRTHITAAEEAQIVALLNEGLMHEEIATRLHRSQSTVVKVAKKNGLLRGKGFRRRKRENPAAEPRALPVPTSAFIKPPTLARLMAGR